MTNSIKCFLQVYQYMYTTAKFIIMNGLVNSFSDRNQSGATSTPNDYFTAFLTYKDFQPSYLDLELFRTQGGAGRYVLKQQQLEGPLTTEAEESLSTEDMGLMDDDSNRKYAKVQEGHTILQ